MWHSQGSRIKSWELFFPVSSLPFSITCLALERTRHHFPSQVIISLRNMSKRHNRKRTRSRPRHRDGGKAQSNHVRTLSVDTHSSFSSTSNSFPQSQNLNSSIVTAPANHWHQTYLAWQDRRIQYEQQRERALEAQRVRFFGGEAGDDNSLLEPMLKVVTDLFDGHTDFEDP